MEVIPDCARTHVQTEVSCGLPVSTLTSVYVYHVEQGY